MQRKGVPGRSRQQLPTFVGRDVGRFRADAMRDMLGKTVLIPLPRPSILTSARSILYRYDGSDHTNAMPHTHTVNARQQYV